MPDPDLSTISTTDAPGQQEPAATDTLLTVESLSQECARLERERTEINDRYLRLAAEFDNFRKRSDREKSEAIEYGSSDALKAMISILDDFERALKVECADAEFARGTQLIYQRMSEALTKLGLEPIAAEGQPFDPNLHYAIDRIEDPNIEIDTVAAEHQRGYTFKGRLLRPAMVRVAVKG
ncbi:MAG: nucleotide exchange factor GrpE [Acidobacteria bacterium]|nr:nucleotide exchange factor GrpE [Acidobacteriota bacterium]